MLHPSATRIESPVAADAKTYNHAELRLKAAVIDRLLAGRHVDSDSVLISEMTIANWSRRADVVLANGKLWAFEIKSESDSLARLPGQLEAFRRHFEKVVVVAAKRFEISASKKLPEGVGLWIEEESGELKQRVPAKAITLSSTAYISLMTAAELRRLLAANGVGGTRTLGRQRLEMLASQFRVADLASAARNAVKRRHRERHREFLASMATHGTLGAMPKLRRKTVQPRDSVRDDWEPTAHALPLDDYTIPLTSPWLVQAPGGPVLKRKQS